MSARSSIFGAGPVRTCIGCRTRDRSTVLLRVMAVDGIVVPDPRCRLPGRGAWLHPDPGCLDVAERRRAFGRALRVPGQPDTSEVREFCQHRLKQEAGRPKVITP